MSYDNMLMSVFFSFPGKAEITFKKNNQFNHYKVKHDLFKRTSSINIQQFTKKPDARAGLLYEAEKKSQPRNWFGE